MFITILLKAPPILKGISSTVDLCFFCRSVSSFNKTINKARFAHWEKAC
jgi:hypothetical protein